MTGTLWLSCSLVTLSAQQSQVNVQELKRQLLETQQNLERQQRLLESLQKQILALENGPSAPASSNGIAAVTAPNPNAASTTAPAPALADTGKKPWSPTDPIRVGGAQSYLNVSLDALVAAGASTAHDLEKLQQGDHDPRQRGFTLQNLETVFEGKVDPYFRGQANIVLKLDPSGETTVEAEEAYLETMALPWNLQFKAGQFLTDFGRLNTTHPHTWDFVDQPLVNNRILGGEGLRNPGARLSWLTPTPFYSELFLTLQNSQGGTAHSFRNDNEGELLFGRPVSQRSVRSLGDMLFTPRYAASFDLSSSQTILAGLSGAFGPNGTGGDTQIYGVDLFWKWKPQNQHGGFPFVTWQSEAMLRRYRADAFAGDNTVTPALAAVPRETLSDVGFYSQLSYGFRKGWIASLRGDWVNKTKAGVYETIVGLDPERDRRWRVSPALTWYPTEFSKIRVQYNYDDRAHIGVDHSVWVQFEFLLGTHAAHKF